MTPVGTSKGKEVNQLRPEDRSAHDWYRFVLSYPPHLVREYLERFGVSQQQCVLDPFCGTGTTLAECKKLGIRSVGVEAHPSVCRFARTKVDWSICGTALMQHARQVSRRAIRILHSQGISDNGELFEAGTQEGAHRPIGLRQLPIETSKLLIKDSISPLPLHKALVLLEAIDNCRQSPFHEHERLAYAKAIVHEASNLRFGPEIGVRRVKRDDAAVISLWLEGIRKISEDLEALQGARHVESHVHNADSRSLTSVLKPKSINAVITSPPYPNEKDYTRTTRLESVLLGYVSSRSELRHLKQGLLRSNTRGVYSIDRDDELVASNDRIQKIADQIEQRRIELGKTSGFERLYARLTKLYFGGMKRHLADLRPALCPGAQLAYVVGDQASYLRVMIRTGQLLADIAVSLGYEVQSLDLFRERLSTATKQQLREEVLVLRWPG